MPEQITIPNNQEIDQALKQFEAESQAGQISKSPEALKTAPIPQNKVEGVQFKVPTYGAVKYYNETDTPKIVKLTMKWVGVKEQKSAEWILFGFVIAAIFVSLYLFFGGSSSQKKFTPELIEKLKQTQMEEIPASK